MIGATAVVSMLVLASAAGTSDHTAAEPRGSTTPPPTPSATSAPRPAATTTTEDAPPTTDAPETTAGATTTSTSTTTTTTSTTVPATTTTTLSLDRPFNAVAFDAVIAAATVDVGDLSAGVAVLRNGETVHTAAFGMENPFEARAATVTTQFRIASISKMFTAVAIMQLVDDGSIDLDGSFTDQLGLRGPFNDPRVGTVTVRQLLSHTSGFTASHGIFFGHGVDTWENAANDAIGQVLKFDPGTAFQYSNTNFCLLGMLLESVTGQPFETAIRERVLEPIGIHAHLAPTLDTAIGDALHPSVPGRNYMEALGPAGGWVTSPLDIATLAAALRTGSAAPPLLNRATVDEMRVPVPVPVEVPLPTNGWSYGLGLILFADGSWGHTGTIESTHAIVINRPDGLTISVLVSGNAPSNTDRLVEVIDSAIAAAYS